jgi:vitamin B12 transporter
MTIARQTAWLAAVVVLVLIPSARAAAEPGSVKGVVMDELGGAIAGAQVTVSDAAGATMGTAAADGTGTFVLDGLPPGRYDIVVESPLFDASRMSVVVNETDDEPLRIRLKISGLTDSVVVTGRRAESKLSETPQQIQVVSKEDIERSAAVDITDVLKKNSGVDVIQYPGLLSGVGMRGFNPEFSGINKRSLLLIDGRPSGVTNLASLLLGNVEHIEVLKGPASAIYGASAMGGVINVITKRSRGPLAGDVRLGLRSFGTSDVNTRVGGSLTSRIDFDASIKVFNQRDDYRVGSGVDKRPGYELGSRAVYPYSSYRNNDGWVRLGADLATAWRIDGRMNVYRARDVLNPGDVFFEGLRLSRRNFDRTTGDVRLQGQVGQHTVTTTVYTAGEESHNTSVKSPTPADQPFLPYLNSESFLSWNGVQVQDAWRWRSGHNLLIGLDTELASSESVRFQPVGAEIARTGPFAADNTKATVGVYAENTMTLRNGLTNVSLGGRVDRITTETLDTPFKTGFTPSATTFNVFNPSVGIKQVIAPGVRAHATAGQAFVAPDAGALTGFNTSLVGGRTQVSQGNPDLRPERSFSFDVGVERTSVSHRLDVTYFQTKVTDRIVSNIVISNPAPPAPIVLSFVNALGARMRGLETDYDQRVTKHVSFSAGLTHYFTRREQLPGSGERDINVVSKNSVRASVDVDAGPLTTRLSGRYLQGRRDLDFNTAGTPQIDYEDFAVADLTALYRLRGRHAVSLTLSNVFDQYYYEKLGFPHMGRNFALEYQIGFGRRP